MSIADEQLLRSVIQEMWDDFIRSPRLRDMFGWYAMLAKSQTFFGSLNPLPMPWNHPRLGPVTPEALGRFRPYVGGMIMANTLVSSGRHPCGGCLAVVNLDPERGFFGEGIVPGILGLIGQLSGLSSDDQRALGKIMHNSRSRPRAFNRTRLPQSLCNGAPIYAMEFMIGREFYARSPHTPPLIIMAEPGDAARAFVLPGDLCWKLVDEYSDLCAAVWSGEDEGPEQAA